MTVRIVIRRQALFFSRCGRDNCKD
jgi:hypothetical protein